MTVRARLGWDDGAFHAYTANISMSGAFVETARPIPEGTIVRLQLDLTTAGAGASVLVSARVERVIGEDEATGASMLPGLGLSFRKFMMGRRALEKFIAQRLPEVRPAMAAKDEDEGDRRLTPRMSVGLPVTWGTTQPPSRRGWLVDLSGGGAFVLEAEGDGADEGTLYLEFDLPVDGNVREVRGIAEVVRTVETPDPERTGMGIRFESATVDVELVCRFVERRRAWEAGLARAAGRAEAQWPEPSRPVDGGQSAPEAKPAPTPTARRPSAPGRAHFRSHLEHPTVRPAFLVALVASLLAGAIISALF